MVLTKRRIIDKIKMFVKVAYLRRTTRHSTWTPLNKTISFITSKDCANSLSSLMDIISTSIENVCVETFFWLNDIMNYFNRFSPDLAVALNHVLALVRIFCIIFQTMLDSIISCTLDVTFVQVGIEWLSQNFASFGSVVIDVRLAQPCINQVTQCLTKLKGLYVVKCFNLVMRIVIATVHHEVQTIIRVWDIGCSRAVVIGGCCWTLSRSCLFLYEFEIEI